MGHVASHNITTTVSSSPSPSPHPSSSYNVPSMCPCSNIALRRFTIWRALQCGSQKTYSLERNDLLSQLAEHCPSLDSLICRFQMPTCPVTCSMTTASNIGIFRGASHVIFGTRAKPLSHLFLVFCLARLGGLLSHLKRTCPGKSPVCLLAQIIISH